MATHSLCRAVHHCNIFGDSVSHNALDLRYVHFMEVMGGGGIPVILLTPPPPPGIGQRSILLECLD